MFYFFVIFISYFFLKWTQITYIIKMLKIDFVLNTVLQNRFLIIFSYKSIF